MQQTDQNATSQEIFKGPNVLTINNRQTSRDKLPSHCFTVIDIHKPVHEHTHIRTFFFFLIIPKNIFILPVFLTFDQQIGQRRKKGGRSHQHQVNKYEVSIVMTSTGTVEVSPKF